MQHSNTLVIDYAVLTKRNTKGYETVFWASFTLALVQQATKNNFTISCVCLPWHFNSNPSKNFIKRHKKENIICKHILIKLSQKQYKKGSILLLTWRFSLCPKCLWQMSQVNGFSPVCTRWCLRSLCASMKFLPQNAQLSFRTIFACLCSLRLCLLNSLDSVNPILQISQWYTGMVWKLPIILFVWKIWKAAISADSPLSLQEKAMTVLKQELLF